jgi:isopentenyl diphosphate isomerase/L-lactate dehydrogenase-like FMN-dependent dehydrogenase
MGPFEFRLRPNDRLVSVEDYRVAAATRVPGLVWEYVEGGADDLVTVRRNEDAFLRWSLRARMMTAQAERRLATTVAGAEIDLPVLLAPTGALGLSNWRGDLAAARAAEAVGTRLILSTASSWSIEEVACGTRAGHFFQLYPGGERTFAWEDLEWIREQWPGSVYVKGLLDPDDALRAVSIGCEGVVVSNHGGRQLDHALASLDALPAIVEAVGGRAEVLVDGGVRRGTDVVKALALGARAVLIGRPQIYGLIVGGQQGVSDVIEVLRSELDRALALMGVQDVHELDRGWLIDRDAAAS